MAKMILVPLDGSAASESILPEVARILPSDGKVDLVHFTSTASPELGNEALNRARRNWFPEARATAVVRTGAPADGILRLALEKNIDLIAMSTHARSGIARSLLGSVAAEVVRKSQLPVLLTRPDMPPPLRAIRRILVPVEGTVLPADLLQSVKFLTPEARAEIVLLRVLDPVRDPAPLWAPGMTAAPSPERRLQELADALEEEGFTAWPVLRTGVAEDEILAQALAQDVDLIAMSTHGRSGLERILEGSVSEGVLRRSPTAVLLQKPLVLHHPALTGGSHA